MKLRSLLTLALLAGVVSPLIADQKPLRVLVVAGGCCHDYANQKEILKKGIEARLNATVEVAYDATKSVKPVFEIYKNADWAKNYDVVVTMSAPRASMTARMSPTSSTPTRMASRP